MIYFLKVLNFILFLFYTSSTFAADIQVDCVKQLLILSENLSRTECKRIDSVIIEAYESKEPKSIYSSDFDRRTVIIAHGEGVSDLANILEIKKYNLIIPPFFDQINKIESPKNFMYKDWNVSIRVVRYTNQNRDFPSYMMKCATAQRSTRNNKILLIECFSFEDLDRLFLTLDLIS